MNYNEVLPRKKTVLQGVFYNNFIIFVFIFCIVSTFYILYNTNHSGYEPLFLLPLSFGCSFVLFLSPIIYRKNNIFLFIFSIVAFLRLVILPLLIVYTGYYGGRSPVPPLPSSYSKGIYLMTYEMIIVSALIYFLFRNLNLKKQDHQLNKQIKLPNNIIIYLLFIVFTLCLLALNPNSINFFAFLSPTEHTLKIGEGSTLQTVTFYLLLTSKYLVFLMFMAYFRKKYLSTSNKIYIILSFIIVLLNISIIFGQNRADFIVPALASLILFYKMYPKYGRMATVVIIVGMVFITSFISEERGTVTRTHGQNPLVDTADVLQTYLGGPYNVAIGIETAQANPDDRSFGNFLYDILRPTIGPNLLLKHVDMEMSSFLFNERIFFSDMRTQNLPIIGQGYLYFGFVFSPIVMFLFLLLVRTLVKILNKQLRIELIFFLTIPIARIGLAMGQNASILMNDISFFLLINIVVYLLNNRVSLK